MHAYRRPILSFINGTSEVRVNSAARKVLNHPLRVLPEFDEDTGIFSVRRVDFGGVTFHDNTMRFSTNRILPKMKAAGFRKDRQYIGTRVDGALVFHAGDWKDRE